MRRTSMTLLGLGALMGALTGCGDEDPTSVGGGLIGPAVRTYEVTLEADAFLRSDTTYDRLGRLNLANFWLVAHDFAGELDAHTVFSVSALPEQVSYQDSVGAQTDSVVAVVGGTVTLVVDTAASTAGPIDLELYRLAEAWDPGTTTWTLRSDTADSQEPWTQPGGTVGELLATTQWLAGDTLLIPLDSQTVALWQDSAAAQRGALIRATTPGSRLVLDAVQFQYDVVPEEAQDTVVQGGSARARVSVVDPEAPAAPAAELRVGGLPAWRTLLHFEPLADLRIPCGPLASETCTVGLDNVTVNLATLVLEPLPVGGRRIERPLRVENRAVLPSPPSVPITRSPLSGLMGIMEDSLTVELFTGPVTDLDPVQVPVTGFVRRLIDPPENQDRWYWLALSAQDELTMFGYAAFASMATATPPRLRLVVSVPEEELAP